MTETEKKEKDNQEMFNIKPAIRIVVAILGLSFGVALLFTETWSLNMFWFPIVLIALSATALGLILKQKRRQKQQVKDKQ